MNANNSKTITLDVPLKRGDQSIDAVTIIKPNSGALRGVALAQLLQLDVASLQTVLPRVTQPTLTRNDVDNLDPADLVQLGTELAGFLVPKSERAAFSPTQ